jgi:hypothetical protein
MYVLCVCDIYDVGQLLAGMAWRALWWSAHERAPFNSRAIKSSSQPKRTRPAVVSVSGACAVDATLHNMARVGCIIWLLNHAIAVAK